MVHLVMARRQQTDSAHAGVFAGLVAVQTSAQPAAPAANDADTIRRHLQALAEVDTKPLPQDSACWVAPAAREYLADLARGGKTMDECMGLKPKPSERSWRTKAASQERDRWLVKASQCIDGSAYRRAQDLAAEVGVFEEIQWLAWQDLQAPPTGTTALRVALFWAFKVSNGDVPGGWRRLREIVQRATGASGT